jgi:single-strand DNA-binding protein
MRYTPSGQAVTNFNVASSRQYTDSNAQMVKETIWFRVSTWGKSAETCNQYLKKGSKVLVEGRLIPDSNGSPRVYQKQDGSHGASFEISASTVRFLSSRAETEGGYKSEETAGHVSIVTTDFLIHGVFILRIRYCCLFCF